MEALHHLGLFSSRRVVQQPAAVSLMLTPTSGKHGRKLLDAGGVWPDLPDDKAKAAEQAAEQAYTAPFT